MAKRHTVNIALRMPPELAKGIYDYAKARNLKTKDGEPNLGAAIRELVAAGLTGGGTTSIAQAAYDNARADLLQEVNEKLKRFARECSEGL